MQDLYRGVRLWATDLDNTLGTQYTISEGMKGVSIDPGLYRIMAIGRELRGQTDGQFGFDTVVITGRGGRDFFPIEGEAPRVPRELTEAVSGLSMEMGALLWTRDGGLRAARFDPATGRVGYEPFELPAEHAPFVETIAGAAHSLGIPETAIHRNLTQCALQARSEAEAETWERPMRAALETFGLAGAVDVVRNRNALNIGQRGVTKGSSIAQIGADFQAGPDQALAMGDSGKSDGPFVRWAGTRVAVRNADAEMRGLAHHVTEREGTMGALEVGAAMLGTQLAAASVQFPAKRLQIGGYQHELRQIELGLEEPSVVR